jgi:hypothetical protein
MRGLSNGVQDCRELRVNGFGQMADPITLMSRYPLPVALEFAGPNAGGSLKRSFSQMRTA